MRIALCLEYPIDQFGGVEVLVSELILGLSVHHQIILVSPDDAASLSRSRVVPHISEHIHFLPKWDSINAAQSLADKIAQARPDVAHFHFGNYGFGNRLPFRSPIYYLSRRNVPCLTTAHMVTDLLEGYCGNQKPLWFKLLMLPLAWCGKMQQVQHVRFEITVSQCDLKKFQAWHWLLRHRFQQIYHSRLRNDSTELDEPKRHPIILNVGHVAQRKGQHLLAAAFAKIARRFPEWSLQFAGPDHDQITAKAIRTLARESNLEGRIQLLGRRDDTPQLMQQAAIYVQPSYYEGLPLALQEAMFRGCPTIASRIGAHEELICENKTGLLFAAGDIPELAHHLEQLMIDSRKRETLGQAAAASIRERKMTATGMVEQYMKLYHAVCPKT